MDPSVWSRGMYSSSIYLDGCNSEHLSSFQPEPMPSKSNDEEMTMFPERAYYSSTDAGSSMICSNQLVRNASRDNTTRRHPSPASSSCGYHDWGLNSGHQAKRARVENIIRGMTSSPGRHCTDVAANQHEESQGMRENKLPLHKERSGPGSASHSQRTKKQFDSQPENLRIRFNHMDPITNTTDRIKEEKYTTSHISHGTSERDAWTDSYRGTHQDWKKVELMNYFQSKPERIKLVADVLKYELSRAVSRSVDSIFKSVPLLQNDQENEETDVPPKSSVCNDLKSKILCCENAEVEFKGVQTEALSLVVQTQRRYKPPDLFSPDLALCEDQPSKSLNAAKHLALRQLKEKSSGVTQAKFETFDARWNPVKVRTKVNSRSVRSPQTHTVSVDPMIFDSLCFPHVKIESDSLVNKDLYRLNEGLTTNHLKKAKLMFFYTRYPSSLVLKMCFHDVQFTRCITSQLIKWFSNFREFFYIQMEKFARHALMEGAADARGLTVGRESELFRTLNMHYNKANDFQVPERFLEVAEITLREFHIAISVGRDRDPSWKKAIYKVICKLDSDVPTEFITHPSG